MKSYTTYILVSLLLLSIVFNIYQATSMPEAPSQEKPPVINSSISSIDWESLSPHEAVFIKRLEVGKIDRGLAETYFCHQCSSEYTEALSRSTNLVLDYKIHNWTKLSDKLWSVDCTIYSKVWPDGERVTNYVGVIGDKFYVMASKIHIPDELLQDVTIP